MSRPVQLGELLELGAASSAELKAWLMGEHETLAHRLQREADVRGESVAQFVRIAVSDFMAEAGEENWTSLISTIRDAPDPGAACLALVTDFRVRLEAPS
jgi:hypothetical protein